MAKAKIQSKVPFLIDSIDRIWGKLIVEMELIENDYNFTINITRICDNNGVQTPLKPKQFTKEFEEINGLYEVVKTIVDQTLPYTERNQRERDMALLIYVQTDFVKDEEGNILEGKTIGNLNPEDWEIANTYDVFKQAQKK